MVLHAFPLAVKPRRRCTSLDPGTAAAIKPCDARAKGTAEVGHRRITERSWSRDARFLVLGFGEACGATPPPWDGKRLGSRCPGGVACFHQRPSSTA